MGPLPALMKLHDEGKLDLDAPFSTIWPKWKNRKDKKKLTIREVFAHQAGLVPYIIFLQEVMKKNGSLKIVLYVTNLVVDLIPKPMIIFISRIGLGTKYTERSTAPKYPTLKIQIFRTYVFAISRNHFKIYQYGLRNLCNPKLLCSYRGNYNGIQSQNQKLSK